MHYCDEFVMKNWKKSRNHWVHDLS